MVVCGRMGAGQNRETDEEDDENFVKGEFQSARVKFDWLGLNYGLVYAILVVMCARMGQDKIGKPMQSMMSFL